MTRSSNSAAVPELSAGKDNDLSLPALKLPPVPDFSGKNASKLFQIQSAERIGAVDDDGYAVKGQLES